MKWLDYARPPRESSKEPDSTLPETAADALACFVLSGACGAIFCVYVVFCQSLMFSILDLVAWLCLWVCWILGALSILLAGASWLKGAIRTEAMIAMCMSLTILWTAIHFLMARPGPALH